VSLLSACGSGVEVTAKFDKVQSVNEGAQVYYLGDVVGEVIEHEKGQQGSTIVLSIKKDAATSIDPNSAVIVNEIKPGSPLEIHPSIAPQEGGVSEGQELRGLNSMFDLIAWSMGDVFKSTANELTAYADGVSNYLESDQFKNDKALVEQGMTEMANSAADAMKAVERDLAEAMADIDVSEEDLAKAIAGLGDDLAPLAQEMARNGTDLMLELERFEQGLRGASAEDQKSGKRLIESVLAAIERLEESAEEGVNEALDKAE
jgi:ABC-type transporter Mla subunit MlaD